MCQFCINLATLTVILSQFYSQKSENKTFTLQSIAKIIQKSRKMRKNRILMIGPYPTVQSSLVLLEVCLIQTLKSAEEFQKFEIKLGISYLVMRPYQIFSYVAIFP